MADNSDYFRRSANELLLNGDLDGAICQLTQAKNQYPHDPRVRNNLGQALVLQCRYDEALVEVSAALSISPSISVAWITKIKIYVHLGLYDLASETIEKAASHNDNANFLLPWRLLLLNRQGMHSLSVALASSADKSLFDDEDFVCQYLEALSITEHPDLGIQISRQYLSKYPDSIDVLIQLALLYQQIYRTDDALTVLKGIIPTTDLHKYNLAQAMVTMYEEQRNIAKAIECAKYCFDTHRDAPRNAHLLFTLHASSGNWKEAQKYNCYRWQLLNQTDPADPTLLPVWSPSDTGACVYVYAEQGIGDQTLAYKVLCHYTQITNSGNIFFLELSQKLCTILPSTLNLVLIPAKNRQVSQDSIYTHHISMYDLVQLLFLSLGPQHLFGDSAVHALVAANIRSHIHKVTLQSNVYRRQYDFALSWRSSNREVGNEQSINLSELLGCLHPLKDCSAVSLQYYPTVSEQSLISNHPFHITLPNTDLFSDLITVADILQNSSHVLSVSTFTAHLAGLMGIPTALFLSPGRSKLWYWHITANRRNSLLYPQISIYEKHTRSASYVPLIKEALIDFCRAFPN